MKYDARVDSNAAYCQLLGDKVMLQNMGTADRIIRILVVLVIAALYFSGKLSGTVAIVLGVIAVAFLVTGLVGFCPAYFPFKISTMRKN
jgi:hypothetical protein